MIPGLAGIMAGRRRQLHSTLYDAWVALVDSSGGTYLGNSKAICLLLAVRLEDFSGYSKIKWLMPLLGADLTAARCPLIDIFNIGIAANTNFVGGDFNQATGLQGDGATKWLSSGLNLNHPGTDDNGGVGYWELGFAGNTVANEVMGSYNNANTERFLIDLRVTQRNFSWGNAGLRAEVAGTASNSHYYGQRSGPTSRELFENGVSIATNTTSQTAAGVNQRNALIVGCNENPAVASNSRCGCAYITDGTLTPTEVTQLHTLLDTYLMAPTGRTGTVYEMWVNNVDAAGGTYETDSKTIAADLVTQLEAQTFYSKIVYLLPFLGANMAAAKVPLIDALNIGTTKNNGFVDGDFDQATGLQGGGGKNLDARIRASQLGATNNGGFGVILLAIGAAGGWAIGSDAGSQIFGLKLAPAPQEKFSYGASGSEITLTVPIVTGGHYYGQRASATDRKLYVDATQIGADTDNETASLADTANIFVMGLNNGTDTTNSRIGVAYLTDGTLTPTEITDLDTLLQTYLITPTGR